MDTFDTMFADYEANKTNAAFADDNVFDKPFSARFQSRPGSQANDWSAMSDKGTCPISKMDAVAIASGNDPFLTNEEEGKYEAEQAMKALTKDAIELAERACRAEFAADYDRYHAELKFIELREMVKASGVNMAWGDWVETNITKGDKSGPSRATVYRYMAFAQKQNPETVTPSHAETSNTNAEETPAEKPRSANADRQARHRERVKAARGEAAKVADRYIDPVPNKVEVTQSGYQSAKLTDRQALLAKIAAIISDELADELIATMDTWFSDNPLNVITDDKGNTANYEEMQRRTELDPEVKRLLETVGV